MDNPVMLDMAQQDRETHLDNLEQFLRKQFERKPTTPAAVIDATVELYREIAARHTAAGWWLGSKTQHAPQNLARSTMTEMTDDDRARIKALAAQA
jgi:hypothetical protein